MASEVDICNLALSRLGDDATVASIDPPEGSAQAGYCARFYPMARDALLEMHAWGFATRTDKLAALAQAVPGWGCTYALPQSALRVLAVLPTGFAGFEAAQGYVVAAGAGGRVVATDQEGAYLRYVGAVVDTTLFPPLFTEALSWLLASHLAGPVLKADAGVAAARACMQGFVLAFNNAKVSDANQRQGEPVHTPAWIAGR